jgi:hypothetical protein
MGVGPFAEGPDPGAGPVTNPQVVILFLSRKVIL